MTDPILLRETRGRIRIQTINWPERSNAMSPELTEELIDAFVHGGADSDVRMIASTAV
jgi:enoyl-CoA hydratase/carnithine racemase